MQLSRGLAVPLGLASLSIGLISLIYGLAAVTVCVYAEGCRPVITWPLVAAGVMLISLGSAGILLKGAEVR